MDPYSFGYNSSSFVDMPISHKAFLAQFDAIKSFAKEGPCVIVGRCADYALADFDNVINLFIYADDDFKCKYLIEHDKDVKNEAEARDLFNKKDKQRQSYYNYYSSKKWGRAESYDLCINSAKLGIDGTVKFITQYVEDYEKFHHQ
jgi:cytidylate kinase